MNFMKETSNKFFASISGANEDGLHIEKRELEGKTSFSFWHKTGEVVLSNDQCQELIETLTSSLKSTSYEANNSLVRALKEEFDTHGTII